MFAADPRLPIARASQLLGQGRLAEAEREIMAAFTLFGRQCGEALFLLGLVRMEQQKREEAVLLLAEAAMLLPLHAGVRYVHGSALVLTGQPEAAIDALREAVRLQPSMVEAWYALGGQQVRLSRFADAEKSYRHVLDLAPGHGETG